MISEVIFLYIIRAIITILGILEAKIMLKYFNQKALGMQTIFDQMIKDKLYLSLLTCTCIITVDIILEVSVPARGVGTGEAGEAPASPEIRG